MVSEEAIEALRWLDAFDGTIGYGGLGMKVLCAGEVATFESGRFLGFWDFSTGGVLPRDEC